MTRWVILLAAAWACLAAGCAAPAARPGAELARRGDEIVVCGRFFHTGAPVVLWTDPGGYDAYRTERRFAKWDDAAWAPGAGPEIPSRYGLRAAGLSDDELQRVRGGGWSLDELRSHVDQFVIHYDAAGTSRQCFKILQDVRGLSVHFMIDLDGTIYQTLDVKERAWHATIANDRSVGVEIANIGAYPPDKADTLSQWYTRDASGTRVTLPGWLGDGGVRTPGFIARPARAEPIEGEIQGQRLLQYDLTDAQYNALIHLTAALCTALPEIKCDYPRDTAGNPLRRALTEQEFAGYHGLLGHYHIQTNKIDPGPAFDWDRVVQGARAVMR